MKRIYFLLSLVFSVVITSAQKTELTQTVRGLVLDKDSKQPLIGATVVVINDTKTYGAATDEQGKFRILNVPVGRKSMKISYVGYEDRMLNDIIINSAKEVVLNIELAEKVVSAKELIISAKANKAAPNNELILVSGRSFTIDQATRYAGALQDPSRMAANFAGVAGGGNDQRNDIVIRGNSPLGLLWRLEGADIPNPNHFSNQGANGGPVSILNNNTLANSDFLTGAFPAEYGNANAGVFDLKIRNGNNEKHEFIGQIGFNGLELLAEGPIKNGQSSYLASYRYSTLSFFDALGFKFGDSGIPFYQDATFKVSMPNTKTGNWSVWGIGGTSSTKLLDSDKNETDRKKEAQPQDIDFTSKMGVLGITNIAQINKHSFIKTVITASGESNRTKVDSLSANNAKFYLFNSNSEFGKLAVHSYFNTKINARNTVKIGVIASRLYGSSSDSVYVNALGAYRSQLDFNETTFLAQAYANWNYRISTQLTFNAGLHYNHYFLNNTFGIDPRAGLRYSFGKSSVISFGYGHHSQIQPMITYFEKTLMDTQNRVYTFTNKELEMTKAHHFVLGYEMMLGNEVRFKTEAYYQDVYNVPVTQNPSTISVLNYGAQFGAPNFDSLQNNGRGYYYGIEFTIEKYFSKGYYYLGTLSLYESKYKASDNKWRNTAFNGNFVLNILAGKEWKIGKNNILSASGKITYAGGKRFVPIDEAASLKNGYEVQIEDRSYENRLKDFFRADIRIGYKTNSKRVTQEYGLDIQNITNRKNIFTQQFNPQTGKVEDLYQIGLFPVPFYRIYF